MALHLIIDGYNLIRQSPGLSLIDSQDLEAGREALLKGLAGYRRRRPQHKITVVFDGWQSGGLQESRGLFQGIGIVYSRRGEKADEVIKRLLHRERQRAVLVTSDRELQDCAARVGAAWITAQGFDQAHLSAGGEAAEEEEGEAAAPRGPNKKGPSKRLPKPRRRHQQRLRKL